MQNKLRAREEKYTAAIAVLLAVTLIFAAMSLFSGVHPCAYEYKSYLLQAQAWLRGETALGRNYEYLELAAYNGKYYVSFPPVPSIPMVLWTLIWGDNVPGGLFQKIYTAVACLVVLFEIRRRKKLAWEECIAWSLLICLGSAMLPIALVGGVWYEAQILAFLFSVGAIAAIRRDRPTLCCLLYALAVGCRPFAAVLGPALLAVHLQRRRPLRRLIPGICLGLLIAAAYGAYNFARFGNIFEFGHNQLPEFINAEHGQLSLRYLPKNLGQMLLGSPFIPTASGLKFYEFGFSMFISCPILICGLMWLIRDLKKHRMTGVKWTLLAMGSLNTVLLAMHRTLGGHQFGLRYALELVPLCLLYLLESPEKRRLRPWEAALMGFGFLFNFIGGCMVHILRFQ